MLIQRHYNIWYDLSFAWLSAEVMKSSFILRLPSVRVAIISELVPRISFKFLFLWLPWTIRQTCIDLFAKKKMPFPIFLFFPFFLFLLFVFVSMRPHGRKKLKLCSSLKSLLYGSVLVPHVKKKKNKSYVGLSKTYVGDNNSCIGDNKSYVENNISYVGDNKSYIGLTIMTYVGFTKTYVNVIKL